MADYQQHLAEFEGLDTEVVALSADNEEHARATAEDLKLEFTVLYGLDPESTSRAIGCYTGMHEGTPHIQPAAFVLRPDGIIALAVYSSGKVGRLTANDALTLVKDLRQRQAQRQPVQEDS